MKKTAQEPKVTDNPLYHDTWMLLRKYRDVVWSLELSVQQVRRQFQIEYGSSMEIFSGVSSFLLFWQRRSLPPLQLREPENKPLRFLLCYLVVTTVTQKSGLDKLHRGLIFCDKVAF